MKCKWKEMTHLLLKLLIGQQQMIQKNIYIFKSKTRVISVLITKTFSYELTGRSTSHLFTDWLYKTEQLFHCFNDHYSNIVTHGTYVNVNERIFWSYATAQPEGIKVCGRKLKGTVSSISDWILRREIGWCTW